MLDTKLEPATVDEAVPAPLEDEARPVEATAEATSEDEALADEVVVEISVDGMCGVY